MSGTEAAPAVGEWPALPYAEWADTCRTLHLFTQVVGKVRLAATPWLNHSWQVPLYMSARGLTTGLVYVGTRATELEFDLVAGRLLIRTDGPPLGIALAPRPVADFYREVMAAMAALGMPIAINLVPNELPDAVPFPEDRAPRVFDGAMAERFWRALLQADRLLKLFRTGFLGKASPVHFFWGSFDLAVTRFSGRPAPPHPGGVPHLPDAVAREAYSHEVSSAGFWPGGPGAEEAAFYAYAWPEPPGFRDAAVSPAEARYDAGLGEFVLPYEAVRRVADPDATLLSFLSSTYAAAADLAAWDRAALDCELGRARPPATRLTDGVTF
ncbi:MAG TPA: DUF5996 family protein [Caulobacteraceae bacterium]|nr:DUF5996 family protein [Caulobacteraceae bacterium]